MKYQNRVKTDRKESISFFPEDFYVCLFPCCPQRILYQDILSHEHLDIHSSQV